MLSIGLYALVTLVSLTQCNGICNLPVLPMTNLTSLDFGYREPIPPNDTSPFPEQQLTYPTDWRRPDFFDESFMGDYFKRLHTPNWKECVPSLKFPFTGYRLHQGFIYIEPASYNPPKPPVAQILLHGYYTWFEARNLCRSLCMEPISINVPEKLLTLLAHSGKLGVSAQGGIWTSGRRCTYPAPCSGLEYYQPLATNGWVWTANGEFIPTDGRHYAQRVWSQTGPRHLPQPDNHQHSIDGREEACAAVMTFEGDGIRMHDVTCDTRLNVVCETSYTLCEKSGLECVLNTTAPVIKQRNYNNYIKLGRRLRVVIE